MTESETKTYFTVITVIVGAHSLVDIVWKDSFVDDVSLSKVGDWDPWMLF